MSKNENDRVLMEQMRGVAASLDQQARAFTQPPAHPVSAPLNIGTHDPKLRHIKDKSRVGD